MGACTFSNGIVIKGTMRDAYTQLVEEANAYNGHQDGYSGDIQTSYGFLEPNTHPKYNTKAFWDWSDKRIDNMSKGDCIGIEIKNKAELKKLKGRRWKGKRGVRAFYFFGLARC